MIDFKNIQNETTKIVELANTAKKITSQNYGFDSSWGRYDWDDEKESNDLEFYEFILNTKNFDAMKLSRGMNILGDKILFFTTGSKKFKLVM